MDQTIQEIDAEPVDHINLTAEIVSAYLSNNHVQASELPALLKVVHAALVGLGQDAGPVERTAEKPTPSQIRKSITPDALISFVDGKPYKTLKRHLSGNGMTIEQYRERYGLPRDYPATAANYSAQRSALTRSLGLGQPRRTDANPSPESASAADNRPQKPRKVGRPRKFKQSLES